MVVSSRHSAVSKASSSGLASWLAEDAASPQECPSASEPDARWVRTPVDTRLKVSQLE
jgi:hypothetical protein